MSERPAAHSGFTSVCITFPPHRLCLLHQQGSFSFAVLSYYSCSSVTWGQRPGKAMPLPVSVAYRRHTSSSVFPGFKWAQWQTEQHSGSEVYQEPIYTPVVALKCKSQRQIRKNNINQTRKGRHPQTTWIVADWTGLVNVVVFFDLPFWFALQGHGITRMESLNNQYPLQSYKSKLTIASFRKQGCHFMCL